MPGPTSRHLEHLERLLADAETTSPDAEAIRAWVERARLAIRSVYGESDSLRRFNKVKYAPMVMTTDSPASIFTEARLSGFKQAQAIVGAVAEDVRLTIDKPEGPAPDVDELHRWVRDAASSLWRDGHYLEAVRAAGTAVERRLKLKLDVHTGSAASIVATAFSINGPSESAPRLRFEVEPEGSDNWRSAHEGAAAFGRGCFMRIRNLASHGEEDEPARQIEALAALSLLARWIDEATVHVAP